jgi:pyruvate/2-oxoglutarate/acetoin dehydrogenase E1 component
MKIVNKDISKPITFTYKDEIKKSMEFLAEDPKTVFLGYGIGKGTNKGGGFFADIKEDQLIETPVAEGLMLSMAIGLSLEGYKPVVFYERMDFLMNAMDALVNHLDKIAGISKGEFMPKVILRCVVGGKDDPFFTGKTHTTDYTEGLRLMLDCYIVKLDDPKLILETYKKAYETNKSCIMVEEKDKYANTSQDFEQI